MGLKDFFMGKKSSAADFSAVPETYEQGQARQEGYKSLLDAQSMIKNQTAPEEQAQLEQQTAQRAASSQLGDVQRRVQDLMAQRGLKNTSVGLGTVQGAEKEARQRIADINASLPERIRQIRQQRAQALAGIGSQMVSSAPQQTYLNKRSGGILPGLMAAGGAALGSLAGPYGTLAGAQIGSGLGTQLTQ